MTIADATIGQAEHIWHRTRIGWHIAFGLLAALAAVLVGTDSGAAGGRAAALAALVLLCAVYALLGVRLLHTEHQPKGLLYVVVAGALILVMFVLRPSTGVLLFIFYPQLWCLLPARRAIAATVVMVVAVGVALGLSGVVGWVFATMSVVIGLALALAIGPWVSKVLEQSMARARLVAELAATRSELAEVSRQAGVLAERERLARDLHDTLAQGENSVLLLLRAAQSALSRSPEDCARHLALAEQTAGENLSEIRALVGGLSPVALDGVSLPAAIRRLAGRVAAELGIPVQVETAGPHHDLPAGIEVPLFRVAQEALANIRKHAAATQVSVRLNYDPNQITLHVTDDGRGFDPDA
ncbi:MAG TPA: sensor histidine kinase, partial [Pseudonocardiaceae bacterium]|nr:sensor histidine kinase [Pseudonocardiaceae bacterium]